MTATVHGSVIDRSAETPPDGRVRAAPDAGTDLDVIRTKLAALGRAHKPADVADAMRAEGMLVSDASLFETVEAIRRDSVGAGRLDPLLRIDGITDVLVNGPERVYIDRGDGLELTGVRFDSDAELRKLAQRLASSVGRRLDDSSPFVDARLPDGTRVHAVLDTLSDPGTCISLRVPARRSFSLDDLVAAQTLPAAGAELLQAMIEAKAAFLISGGTGSGKTTLLATLLSLVPARDRLVVVEDSRELAPQHPHVVRLEGRPANAERAGAVTLTDLVRQALRMRPDRLIVGEVRGAEIVDLLAAMNTGHEGGCGTVHANSATDVPARLEALAAVAGMTRAALHAQAGSALDALVHISRTASGQRRIAGVHVVQPDPVTGLLRTSEAVRFDGSRSVSSGPGAPQLEAVLSR
jgi:pilus assembly protein CpaF